ncbi:hypothetical protein ASG31_01625 [Chryseobacterium sp. Leaf404]|nr:hypothetical protein ASG31_01625 [Chryseobacterium sp. Leaf404]
MMNVIERQANLKDFLFQKYFDSSNNLPNWIITSMVFVLAVSVLMSQYIPVIPRFIAENQIFGYHFNKFGYTLAVVSLFYFVRTGFSFLLYHSIGDGKKWNIFYFTSTKLQFVVSMVMIALCVMHYYFPIDKTKVFFMYVVFFCFVFIFKVLFYMFHKNNILPAKWYYKFLYICTLQIAPLLMLWKLLFF